MVYHDSIAFIIIYYHLPKIMYHLPYPIDNDNIAIIILLPSSMVPLGLLTSFPFWPFDVSLQTPGADNSDLHRVRIAKTSGISKNARAMTPFGKLTYFEK